MRVYGSNNNLSIFSVPLWLNKRRSLICIYFYTEESKKSFTVNILKLFIFHFEFNTLNTKNLKLILY